MARPTTDERLRAVHDEALAEYDRIQVAQRDERKQALQDRRFYSITGAQWESELGEQFENRPRFEINKVHLAVIRIFNEYRNNRITADFVPKDGSSNDDIADMCDGLFRADEQDSGAEEAYDNAFEEGVGGGMGAWRLRACYEDEEDEDNDYQRIRIEPIFDADTSVYFDLDAKRQDKSDAKCAFVVHSMTVEAYKAEYNDDPATWPKEVSDVIFDWSTPNVVYVAEYYRVEEARETVRTFIRVGEAEPFKVGEAEYEERQEELSGPNVIEIAKRRIKRRRVRKYILSGGGVLEDCGYIAGKHIPIIPFYGKRWFVDNVERFMGHVRLAKDVQCLKNMAVSWLAEIAATSPVSKPIFAPEQIAGHQVMWAEDNIKQYPYLLANPLRDAEGNIIAGAAPQAYTKAPEIPQAMAALLQILDIDLAEVLGSQQNGDQLVSNISGKAVEMIQQRLDMQAFIYLSNFAKAMQRCGVVWLSMAQELYREKGRKLKMIGEMGNAESIELGREELDTKTGQLRDVTDLGAAKLDVVVDVGPSFSSKRDATVRALTGVLQMAEDPADRKILTALIMMNMDGEGLGDVREYNRKQLVALGVLQPNEEERAAMQAAAQQEQPDAQQAYLMSEAEKNAATADKLRAETALTDAKTEQVQVDTLKTASEIGQPTGL